MASDSLIEWVFFHFSQENHHKRKTDQHLSPLKKSRQSDASISTSMEPIESRRKSPDRSQRHCTKPTVKGIASNFIFIDAIKNENMPRMRLFCSFSKCLKGFLIEEKNLQFVHLFDIRSDFMRTEKYSLTVSCWIF